jgi:CBS domain-containing protein
MIDQGWTAVVVMDDDGDARGWINERMLAVAFTLGERANELTAAQVLDEDVPEAPADIPLSATVQLMADSASITFSSCTTRAARRGPHPC